MKQVLAAVVCFAAWGVVCANPAGSFDGEERGGATR